MAAAILIVTECGFGSDDSTDGASDVTSPVTSIVRTDCESSSVGLALSFVPPNWSCRVVDVGVPGVEGFTLFADGASVGSPGLGIEITIGSLGSLPAPCEALERCDEVEPIDLGSTFETTMFDLADVPIISGRHTSIDADVSITAIEPLSPDDVAFITRILDSVVTS